MLWNTIIESLFVLFLSFYKNTKLTAFSLLNLALVCSLNLRYKHNSVLFILKFYFVCPQAVTDPLIAPVSENISIDVNRKCFIHFIWRKQAMYIK